MSYFSNLTQNVVESVVNSSTANLGAGATFTGIADSTLGVAGLQIGLYTTQNCTVYVDQSNDGTNWDIVDSFDYRTTKSRLFGITVQAISTYFRVRVTNLSATVATTEFRLSAVKCPIVEAVPRALSAEGNLKVGVYEIEDEVGNKVKISPNGGLKVTKVVRLAGVAFVGATIDTNFWNSIVASGGTGVQTGGQFEMRTNTTANGASALQSTRVARYINGVSNYCRIQADYGGAVVANNTKRWGCFTGSAGLPTDGVMFELINGVQSIATYNGGVATRVNNGSFNGDYGATINILPSNIQTFEIWFNNRYVFFYFNNILAHKVEATTAPWSGTLSLPLRAENYNTGGGIIDTSLKIRSFVMMRFGEAESRPHWKYQHGALAITVLKYGPGTLQRIINNSGVGTSITLYDALSAINPIAIIDPGTVRGNIDYNLDFYTGLSIVSVGGTCDFTIVYE